MTPYQLNLAFEFKQKQLYEQLMFQQSLTRLVNYYQFVTTQGSKEVKNPVDLYKLNDDEQRTSEISEKFINDPIPESDLEFLKRFRKN